MKKLVFTSFVLLFAYCTISFSQTISQTFSDNFTTPEGQKLQAFVTVEKESIMLGETTYILFEIKNFSNVDFYTGVGGDYRNNLGRPESYGVKVVRDDGKSVPQPEVKVSMGGLFGNQKIPANGSYKVKLYLPHWAIFEEIGNYSITVRRVFSIKPKNEINGKEIFEAPKVAFNAKASTKIKIIKTNQDDLGKVIDELGTKLLDMSAKTSSQNDDEPQRDAGVLLRYINDNRAIKYFALAIEKCSTDNDYSTCSIYKDFARALSKFTDDSALVALKAVIQSKNKDLRLDVADALTYSKHPDALKTLLQMQDDSYWFVRLRVVQAFGSVKSKVAKDLMTKMVNDENEFVSKEAKRYLNDTKNK